MTSTTDETTEAANAADGPKAISIKEALRRKRVISCKTPSLIDVKVRPVNLERHALSGGLPSGLRAIAEGGVEAVDKAIKESVSGDYETLEYLDALVCQVFVEPAFARPRYAREDDGETKRGDLIQGDRLDDYLLPADYRWALLLAYGEVNRDGEGRLLWGVEPLSRFAPFRFEHGCAEDCEACQRARRSLSELL